MTVFDDLGAEQERLEGILGGLDEAQWMSASGRPGGRWPTFPSVSPYIFPNRHVSMGWGNDHEILGYAQVSGIA